MTGRERFRRVMAFEEVRPFPFMEYMGFWPETRAAWDEHVAMDADINAHFGYVAMGHVPVDFNFVPAFRREVVEETEEWQLVRDEQNCLKKEFKNSSAMPHYLEFPITGRESFEGLRERLNPASPERYPGNWDELVRGYAEREYPLQITCRGPFAFGRDFIEFTQYMMLFYDDPDFVAEMFRFHVDFVIGLWERALSEVEVDVVYIGEDMAYKNGPMVSVEMFEKLLLPEYQRLTAFVRGKGVQTIVLDSDGNIEPVLDLVVAAGFDAILPMERAAGMEPERIREKYPRLKLIGGVDKLKIAAGGGALEEEVGRAARLVRQGGYIPSLDHSVPPIVSYERYVEYVDKLRAAVG